MDSVGAAAGATRLRFFTNSDHRPSSVPAVVMLQPFIGRAAETEGDPTAGRFADYFARASDFFEPASPAQADFHVHPIGYESVIGDAQRMAAAQDFVEFARRAGKPAVFFFCSDLDSRISSPGSVVFQTSLYRSQRAANEHALPGWHEDFLVRYFNGQPQMRRKTAKPTVGFCGFAAPWAYELRYRLARLRRPNHQGDHRFGPVLRARALRALARSRRLATNFVVNHRFWGGALDATTSQTAALAQARARFVRNLVECDYALCVRGTGNYSYRLYEALSCGRIPVFLDTDCVLPYDEFIDWKQYCVWIPEEQVDKAGALLADFHAALHPDDFEARQLACRSLWERWISPVGFFSQFHRYFPKPAVRTDHPANS